MSHIRLMKLAGLFTENKLNELNSNVDSVTDLFQWEWYGLFNKQKSFNIVKNYNMVGMRKNPTLLTFEDLEQVLADCDDNINKATTVLAMANKVKQQIEDLSDMAKDISAGELQYKNTKLTAQDVLNFLKSIFIDDKTNLKEIYERYNATIRKELPGQSEYLLSSKDDLVGRGILSRNKSDISFEFKRKSGGKLIYAAIQNSLFKFLEKNYPEVADTMYIYLLKFAPLDKKVFVIKVKKTTKKIWRRIFTKYARWSNTLNNQHESFVNLTTEQDFGGDMKKHKTTSMFDIKEVNFGKDPKKFADAYGGNNIRWKDVTLFSKAQAKNIMSQALPDGYNDFKPSLIDKLPSDAKIQIAREGSVCLYVTTKTKLDRQSLKADELTTVSSGIYRIWWD